MNQLRALLGPVKVELYYDYQPKALSDLFTVTVNWHPFKTGVYIYEYNWGNVGSFSTLIEPKVMYPKATLIDGDFQ